LGLAGLGSMAIGCRSLRKNRHMKRETCTLEVKVLAHWLIQRYTGDAILAAADPRFVVALLIANTKSQFSVDNSTSVSFTTHRVGFFAIGSITKVFAESDIDGKEYRMLLEEREIDGKKSYSLSVTG